MTKEEYCPICGDKTNSIDEHLSKKHERPASGDEDARGGASKP